VNKRKQTWAIVGGGFLGMTLALRLSQQGKAVTLFESAPMLGGLASSWTLGDVVWDRHYHVTLPCDEHLRSLLGELGLGDELQWATTRTGFYSDCKLYSLSNTLEFLKFPLLNFSDKVRLGATILYASKVQNWQALEKIPVTEWLERWSGRRVMAKIWHPLLRAKLGEDYHRASAAFIWSSIARMYSARQAGAKKEVFGYVAGGYARVIERYGEVLAQQGVCCRLGTLVERVRSHSGTGARVELATGAHYDYDHVALTTACPLTVRMCPDLTTPEKDRLNRIQYQGIICMSLLLEESLSEFYITNITDAWVPYTAVIEMSALVDRRFFGGRALVYLPKYVSATSPEFNLTDKQMEEKFLNALEHMYPKFSRSSVLSSRVSRVKYLLPIPTLNYSKDLPGVSTSIPGIHIVNSAHIVNGTLNVNETVQLANTVADGFADLPDSGEPIARYEHTKTDRQPVA
jgi:protoporphyrinogen oxidase